MNGDPYRTPQPADRRVINRSGQSQSSQRVEDQPQPVKDEQLKTSPRSSGAYRAPQENQSSKKSIWWTLAVMLLIIAVAFGGWLLWSANNKNTVAGIETDKYQTVYLMNGQIYFGKLTALNDTQLKLTNVYFLQTNTTDETAADASDDTASKAQLIKLSEAIYDPQDEMIISKSQMLYFQNLRDDGRAAQLIKDEQ